MIISSIHLIFHEIRFCSAPSLENGKTIKWLDAFDVQRGAGGEGGTTDAIFKASRT